MKRFELSFFFAFLLILSVLSGCGVSGYKVNVIVTGIQADSRTKFTKESVPGKEVVPSYQSDSDASMLLGRLSVVLPI